MRLGQDVWEHIRNVRWAIARYLKDVPNSCLRFEDNKALFIMLTLKGGPKLRYRVITPELVILAPGEGAVGVTGNLWEWMWWI